MRKGIKKRARRRQLLFLHKINYVQQVESKVESCSSGSYLLSNVDAAFSQQLTVL